MNHKEFIKNFKDPLYAYIFDPKDEKPPLPEHARTLSNIKKRQSEYFGVFFTPNGFKGTRRRKEDLTSLNCNFLDIDAPESQRKPADLNQFKNEKRTQVAESGLIPTFTVETQKGLHFYWLYKKPKEKPTTDNIEKWNETQRALVEMFDGDPQAKDVSRVLRLPDTLHQKNLNEPFTIKLLQADTTTTYTINSIRSFIDEKYYEEINTTTTKFNIHEAFGVKEGARDDTLYKTACSLLGKEVDKKTVLLTLYSINNGFKPPLKKGDVEVKYKSAVQFITLQRAKDRKKIMKTSERYFMSGHKHPVPLLIFENICRVVEDDEQLNKKFRLNDFSHMTEAWSEERKEWVNLSDSFIYEALRHVTVNHEFFRNVSRTMLTDAIMTIAIKNKVNPPKDYIKGLVWDKKLRLDNWLMTVYGVPDEKVYQKMGSNWIKGLVKRVIRPGCKFDEVLVLQGKQGMRKSFSLHTLGNPWYIESVSNDDDKDFYMTLAQNIIVDFSEGAIHDRAGVKKIKALVTKVEDQYRPPYERGIMKFPRSCVFAMTTNEESWQKDDTGGRRWLPVTLTKQADTDWLKENRDQLYAEAYYRVIELKETTWEYPQDELEDIQQGIQEHSDYDDDVVAWYLDLSPARIKEGIRSLDAYCGVFGFDKNMNRADEMRMAGVLRKALFLKNSSKRKEGKVYRVWIPSEKTKKKFDLTQGCDDLFDEEN